MWLFIYLFVPILWCSHIGNRPQKGLAKFGYGAQKKIEKNLKNIAIFLATCWNLLSSYGNFISFNYYYYYFFGVVNWWKFAQKKLWSIRPYTNIYRKREIVISKKNKLSNLKDPSMAIFFSSWALKFSHCANKKE
jgi:hypothetical protein